MSKLNQVIAVESGVKKKTNETMSTIYKAVQHPAMFDGFNKTYKPINENGDQYPPEKKLVQLTAPDVVKEATRALSELFDVTATKDFANCAAKADVVVDDLVILNQVPVTYLLFLEKQLTDLHTLVAKLPVLDPAETWNYDANSNMYRTETTSTIRTAKEQQALVLYPATDKHPAQTQLITKDVTVGTWEQVKFSGAFPKPVKEKLLMRIEKLQKAVKYAREEANTVNYQDVSVGNKVFDWILGG